MPSSNAPGIFATINSRPLGQPAPAQGSDAFFVVGWALFGPVLVPTLITSWNDYVSKFGGLHPNSEMANAIYLFFKNGGRRAWIVRMSPTGTAPTISINDQHATTPATTISITAKYPSILTDLKYTITVGSITNTVNLKIESKTLGVTEIFRNFKLNFTTEEQELVNIGNTPLYSIARVNNESQLVDLANLNSATASPNNLPALGTGTLTGGTDNIAAITSLDAALAKFSEQYGPGQVCAPGFTGFTDTVIQHADDFKRIAIPEIPDTVNTAAEILAWRANLDTEYGAAYFPSRIRYRDFGGSGLIREYAPMGAAAALYARAEREVGIHKAPANYRLTECLGWDIAKYGTIDDAQRETLNENQINAIAFFPEQGIRVYGARVLKSYGRVTAIHEQRILNQIYYRLTASLREFVFQPADQKLFREIRSTCNQYMRELYRDGALYSPSGEEADAYRVVCDTSNNPAIMLQQHKVNVDVWVHLVGMAEIILLQINSVPLATEFDSVTGGN